ncbi:MAG: M20/M25/M40 family metallo-hydrolase [Acidimicrobiia bacterium]
MIPAGELSELLVALIRNQCVNDGSAGSGGESRSVETLAAYFGEPGLVFEPHPGRQSVVYRVPGSRPGAPRLMLMGHLDVVPVTPEGWAHDPFEGERADGFIWGRGAVDMLNLTASMAAVFRRYLSGDLKQPPGDLIFLGVADEEAGGLHGAGYLVENHWDDVGCEYLLTEIASPMIPTPLGPRLPVTVAEKGPYWRRIRARGTPGHGSQPYAADNALLPVAEAVTRLSTAPTPVEITPEWRHFVEGLGLPDDRAAALLDPERIDEEVERIAASDPGYARWIHACTHLTISPNRLSAGVKVNVIPDRAAAELDVRALPGQDDGTVDEHLDKVLGPELGDRVEVDPVLSSPASSSPPQGPLWEAIGEALTTVNGSGRPVPTMIPVGTDARFFRKRGTVAYGVGLFDDRADFGNLLAMFHGNDERVTDESLELTAALVATALQRFGEKV